MPENGEPTRKELYLSLSRRAKEPFYMQANYYIFLPQDYIEWRSHYVELVAHLMSYVCLSLAEQRSLFTCKLITIFSYRKTI